MKNEPGTLKNHQNQPGIVQDGYGWFRWLQETPRRKWWFFVTNKHCIIIQPAREVRGPEGPARWYIYIMIIVAIIIIIVATIIIIMIIVAIFIIIVATIIIIMIIVAIIIIIVNSITTGASATPTEQT